MAHATQLKNDLLSAEEIARRGKEIYEREIKQNVIAEYQHQLLSVDVVSGDYEVGPDPVANVKALRARRPEAVIFGLRVGHETAYKTGYMVIQ